MHGLDLLVQVYSGISHSDSVTVVPSFYFYFKVTGWGKDRWLQAPSSCSRRTQGVVASFWLQPENWGVGYSLKLQPEKIGGWSLLPVVARKQRKMMLPMNVILKTYKKKYQVVFSHFGFPRKNIGVLCMFMISHLFIFYLLCNYWTIILH